MSLLVSAAFSLLPAIWPFGSAQSVTHDYVLPVWQYSETQDRFAQAVRCKVFVGRRSDPVISYGQRSLVFHFSPRTNTQEAIYRLDGGPSKRWQDLYPKIMEVGATLEGGSLANPTGGLVIVPVSELAGIHTVTIRPTPTARPKIFTIDGYADAIEAARARGCKPETAFVR